MPEQQEQPQPAGRDAHPPGDDLAQRLAALGKQVEEHFDHLHHLAQFSEGGETQ